MKTRTVTSRSLLLHRVRSHTFPYVTLWIGGDVGIGSNEPQRPVDPAHLQRILEDPVLRRALEDAGIGTVDALVDGPMLNDDRPVLEYFATLPYVTRLAYGDR